MYRLLLATGALGQATEASCTGTFLQHLISIHVLHDFLLSRFQKGGNSRLNVNKISFPLMQRRQLLLHLLAVNLRDGLRDVERRWKERCHCQISLPGGTVG